MPIFKTLSNFQIRTAAELARWDESKKWLHKIEVLKEKLKDADAEVSKLSKSNNSLRDMVSRLEREKLMLENRAKGKSHAFKKYEQFTVNTGSIITPIKYFFPLIRWTIKCKI